MGVEVVKTRARENGKFHTELEDGYCYKIIINSHHALHPNHTQRLDNGYPQYMNFHVSVYTKCTQEIHTLNIILVEEQKENSLILTHHIL